MPSVKNQSAAFALLDAFVGVGGNFIHTDYSKRRGADYLADWMVERRNREKIVLSVEFSGVPKWWDDDGGIQTLWLLRGRTDLHLANRMRYTGVAHVPAYAVAATNAVARQAGLIPFSVYRGAWNCWERYLECEIPRMCMSEYMALLVSFADDTTRPEQSNPPKRELHHIEWLRRKYAKVDTGNELRKLIARRPASERVPGVDITPQMMIVAIVRHMEDYPYVFPALTVEYAEGRDTANVSLGINVTAEEKASFDAATKFDRGFPSNVVNEPSPMAASGGGSSTVGN